MMRQARNPLPEHCRSLFLGDLPCFCHENDVADAFRRYGEIENIRLMRGRDKKCLGYGFIIFTEMDSAVAAQEMDGELIVGRSVKYALPFSMR
jgi:RNA recognition motif-containing protein